MKSPEIHKSTGRFLDTAIHLGERLSREAIWYDGRCTWTGDDVSLENGEWKVVHRTVDPYFYAGTAGIAWFLTLCFHATSDVRFRNTARKTAIGALRQSLYLAEKVPKETQPLGLYDGLTGIALIAQQLSNQLESPELETISDQLTSEICRRIDLWRVPDAADLVSGIAGILLGLIHLAGSAKNDSLHTRCDILYRRLLKRAHRTDYGFSWPDEDLQENQPGLCGMGHGASGIAYALVEYSQLTGNKESIAAAYQAVTYERSWFHGGECNWPDIRDMPNSVQNTQEALVYPVYWCHGAAGIGLVRLRAYQATRDNLFLAEAGAAIQAATRLVKQMIGTTRRTGRVSKDINLSLCHGLGSVIDLFVYAYQVLGNPEFVRRARDLGEFSLKISTSSRGREYWRCGIHDGGEAPGLMLGIAGIGCTFLQLHKPSVSSPVGLFPTFRSLPTVGQ